MKLPTKSQIETRLTELKFSDVKEAWNEKILLIEQLFYLIRGQLIPVQVLTKLVNVFLMMISIKA
jgi:hypothetical protein